MSETNQCACDCHNGFLQPYPCNKCNCHLGKDLYQDCNGKVECQCRLINRAHEITTRSVLNDLWTRQKLLEKRIKELEVWTQEDKDFVYSRLKELEHRLSEVEKWKKTAKILCDQSKKPHSCPICEGLGYMNKYINKETRLMSSQKCNACEGKGIVWK